MWGGKIRFHTAMKYAIGMIITFTVGGVSGVMHATSPHNLQQTDTYFVVAHFHYVLIGGLILAIFGSLYYWFPKITGRTMSEKLGSWQFWLFFIGFNITFMPQHWIGLLGMPRRIFTYSADIGLTGLNQLSTAGVFVQMLGVILLAANVVWSLRRGQRAGPNPWGGATLEWATTSPPPEHNFNRIPQVHTREPLWLEARAIEDAARGELEPNIHMPHSSYWPILTGLFVVLTFVSFMTHVWWVTLVPLGMVMLCAINWAYE
jgi:cytochrome c oxidase subunit 1